MRYQLKELFDNLEITLTELKHRSGISDVTLISIRNGNSARRSTINTLLRVFSEIYGVKLTLKNVDGIIIQGKPVGGETPITEQSAAPSTSTSAIAATPQPEVSQKRPSSAKNAKRSYKPRKTGLPEGCILASDFARMHGVNERTFIDHMTKGLGPGLIGTSTDTVPQRDQVDYSERVKPGRKRKAADGRVIEEKEKYLTPEQQTAALDFWRRHGVEFMMPET